jgi:hypothetical protein
LPRRARTAAVHQWHGHGTTVALLQVH